MAYLAWVASVDDRPARAARLLGAEQAIREAIGQRLAAAPQKELDTTLATLRATLGDTVFAAAMEEGRSLRTDRAIEYALEESGPS